MTGRIQRLRERFFEQDPKVCSERCKIFTESIKKDVNKPIAIRRANAYYNVLNEMTV